MLPCNFLAALLTLSSFLLNRGERIRVETPGKRGAGPSSMGFGQRDAESQQIMQQMSDDFVVDEESMKVLMDGEGFDEHL